MNTIKTPAPRTVETRDPALDDLKTAYQIHALVQMITMRVAGPPHWMPMAQPPLTPFLH